MMSLPPTGLYSLLDPLLVGAEVWPFFLGPSFVGFEVDGTVALRCYPPIHFLPYAGQGPWQVQGSHCGGSPGAGSGPGDGPLAPRRCKTPASSWTARVTTRLSSPPAAGRASRLPEPRSSWAGRSREHWGLSPTPEERRRDGEASDQSADSRQPRGLTEVLVNSTVKMCVSVKHNDVWQTFTDWLLDLFF